MRSRSALLLRLAGAFEFCGVRNACQGAEGAGPGSMAQLALRGAQLSQQPTLTHLPLRASLLGGQIPTGFALQRHRLTANQPLLIRSFAQQAPKRWGELPAVSMQGLIIAMIIGAAGITAIKSYKDQKLQQVMTQSQQVVGKASVGGPFDLIDYNNKPFTDKDLRGEFALLYFGFTNCPDICPDELEKVAEAIDLVEKQVGVSVVPVFISVDPERDTPARIKAYVKEFHPRMLGLTGDLDDIKKTSKSYRVYYSKTGDAGAKDYLVDHSIIHYLIDPDGEFVTFYAKSYTAEQMAESIMEHVATWKEAHPQDYHPGKTIKKPEAVAGKPA